MSWWRRFFGLDPVDVALHILGSIFVVAAMNEASHSDAATLITAAAAAVVAFGIRRKIALRGVRAELAQADQGRVAELEERMARLEEGDPRMLELEERLDFAERLLAQRQEPMRLDAGRKV